MSKKEAHKYHVLVVDEGKPAKPRGFSTFGQLTTYLTKLVNEEVDVQRQVFVFQGARWLITPGDYKYLTGERLEKPVPLFAAPFVMTPREDGRIDIFEEHQVEPAYQAIDAAPVADPSSDTQPQPGAAGMEVDPWGPDE